MLPFSGLALPGGTRSEMAQACSAACAPRPGTRAGAHVKILGTMTRDEFKASLDRPAPPPVSTLLLSLWHDARGDWETAHRIAQDVETPDGAWVHAYLHRKEGDIGNARYWYRRASRPEATDTLAGEWERLVTALL